MRDPVAADCGGFAPHAGRFTLDRHCHVTTTTTGADVDGNTAAIDGGGGRRHDDSAGHGLAIDVGW